MIDDHEVLQVLARSPERLVVCSNRQGVACCTHLYLQPLELTWNEPVRDVCAGRQPVDGLPHALAGVLEGYGVRARLGELRGLPEVVAAGVTRTVPADLGLPPEGQGYAYLSRQWVEGAPLDRACALLPPQEKLALLRGLLRSLDAIHSRQATYGAIEPREVVVAGAEPWLIGLHRLRMVTSEAHVTRDLRAWGGLARWLLAQEGEGQGGLSRVSSWLRRVENRMGEAGSVRAADLLAVSLPASEDENRVPVGVSRRGSAQDTVVVADHEEPIAPAPEPAELRTLVVPDDDPPWTTEADRGPCDQTIVVPDEDERDAPVGPVDSPTMVVPEDSFADAVPTARERGGAVAPQGPAVPTARERGGAASRQVPASPRASVWVPGPAALVLAVGTVLVALALLAVVAGVVAVKLLSDRSGTPVPASSAAEPAERPFASCEGEPPTAVQLAELGAGTPVPSAQEIASRFTGIPEESVLVYRLTRRDPRTGSETRSISFELTEASWPQWAAVAAGASGEDLCRRLSDGIRARMGRLSTPLQFHSGRRIGQPSSRDETVISLATPGASAFILDWLEPLQSEAQCTYQRGWGGGTLVIRCSVVNTRSAATDVRVMPTLYRAGGDEPVHREQLTLDPGERIVRQYRLRGAHLSEQSRCGCRVVSTP